MALATPHDFASLTLHHQQTVVQAARFLLEHDLDGARVIDDEQNTIGVLTKTSLMKVIAGEQPCTKTIGEIMEADVELLAEAEKATLEQWKRVSLFSSEEIQSIQKDHFLWPFYEVLQQKKKEWLAFFDAAYNPILAIDTQGRISLYNHATEEITQVPAEDAQGRNINDVFNTSRLVEVVQNGQPQPLRKIEAAGRTFISNRTPVFVDGELIGAIAVLQTTSDLEQIVQELESTQKLNRELDAIIESSYDGLYITDGEGITLRLNKAFERITGVTSEECVGRNMAELVKEGYFSRSGSLLAIEKRQPVTITLQTNTGKMVLVTSTPIMDDNNEIVLIVTNVRDMTDLIELERKLEHVEGLRQKELTAIFDSSYDGLYITDGQGYTIKLNQAFERITGVTAEECVGRHMAELVREGYFSRSGTLLAIEKRHPVTITLQAMKSGKTVLVTSTPVFDETGDIVLVVTNVRDMTELIDLERKLEHMEGLRQKELAAIFEASYDGLYITDGEGKTLRLNKAFERIMGIKEEECVGRNMSDLVENGVFSRSGTLLALEQNDSVTISLQAKTGKNALVTSTPIYDEEGKVVMVVTNVRDITELNHLENKLEHLEGLSKVYQAELQHLKSTQKCVAHSRVMRDLLRLVNHVAAVDSTVLIQGESGVGKEVVADMLHNLGSRKNKPFIKINCGAIPHNLLESELFGYEPGAFSGASKKGKAGMFELADGGMLFLDEIGEMPINLQVKLLRVLQDNTITRIGGTKSVKVDVRIIAGTNRKLQEMVVAEQFRKDLFYRLNVVPIVVPALRDRREDIPVLSKHFLNMFNRKYRLNKQLSGDVIARFMSYDWPGNVRELENLIERLVVTTLHDTITLDDVSAAEGAFPSKEVEGELPFLNTALENTERRILQRAFNMYDSTYKVALALGVSQPTVVRKAAKYGISRT